MENVNGDNALLSEEEKLRKLRKEQKAKEKEEKKKKASEKAKLRESTEVKSNKSKTDKQTPSNNEKEKVDDKAKEDAHDDEELPETVPGNKKNLSPQLAKSFSPKAVEAYWYEWWEKCGYFTGDNSSTKPKFVIVVPPPNVTGALHIGHALTASIEDMVVRWKRMSGFNVCWVPGCDHAGIATQVVVEKQLMKERGLTRHDIGRENFVKEVWKWKEAYGNKIMKQQRKMGASLDWTRECFTMDEKLSIAVCEAFVNLHERGLIYRDNRLVNWDCILKTAISDIEVDYQELKGRTPLQVPNYAEPVEFGVIISFAYPLDGYDDEIVVATTRVETMLGDTAVAVHPEDSRYKKYHGKFAVHPFNGRKIPIICDAELVDMSFGTGAVKITPAHDPNDFATGKRHQLEFINIFTDEGLINSNGGAEFEGMKRFDARKIIIKRLEEKGLYRGKADNPMRLGICSRSGDVIEPIIKPQWYVSCSSLASAACNAVREGKLNIIPRAHEDTWFRWLENIHDWCISRQLWWGHQIPAYYATLESDQSKEIGAYNDRWISARSEQEAQVKAKAKFGDSNFTLTQDPDVLDTWFSSGLFPFSVFGWPSNTEDVKKFYPTSLLETGHDILFFWVARMVMLGIALTSEVPFQNVFLHAMVRDAHGRKMSKSLGNVIDPLEVIHGATLQQLNDKLNLGNLDKREVEKAKAAQARDFPSGIPECGCDALRFSLISYTLQEVNINLDIQRVVGYRLWCNKLWNAIRFALMNLGSDFIPDPSIFSSSSSHSSLPRGCTWILSSLNSSIKKTVASLENYEFSQATTFVYAWWQYDLCDVFIEITKPALSKSDGSEESERIKKAIRNVLWLCLDNGLRLLHPFMPFVTEELWQRLPGRTNFEFLGTKYEDSIMISPYPVPVVEWEDKEVEDEMAAAMSVVRAVRSLRMDYNLQKNQRPALFVQCKNVKAFDTINNWKNDIKTLALLDKVEPTLDQNDTYSPSPTSLSPPLPPPGCAVSIINESMSAHLLLTGLLDVDSEVIKLNKRKDETLKTRELLKVKMDAPGYVSKVPKHVQEENEKKMSKILSELQSIDDAILNFQKLSIVE